MFSEEEKIFRGELFRPTDSDLKALKLRAHRLSRQFSALDEADTAERETVLRELLLSLGKDNFFQGPVFFHYGVHTSIGDRNFFNYHTVIQDDARVTIGNDNRFGPNFTVVTPLHPLLAEERRTKTDERGEPYFICYAKPVRIGNDCWFGVNVTVCPGVTIGDRCVIGAGSVVTHDIPSNSLAWGVPCRVIRELTEADSIENNPELFGQN